MQARRVAAVLLLLALQVPVSGCSEQVGHRILAFTAKWCPACTFDKAQIKQSGLDVEMIDVDEQPELADHYHINVLPTYLILENDREVSRTNRLDDVK